MRVFNELNFSERQKCDRQQIKPGTIWEISRSVPIPLEFSEQEQQSLYSDVALQFLSGNSPPRYAMIVREPEPVEQDEWQIVSVMVLSVQTDLLSNVDLLIPAEVSGVGRDLLAQTWHVLPMLVRNLSHLVGKRLSRQVYDALLNVGDYYYGLIDVAPSSQEIQLLGLKVGISAEQPEIQAFHRQEEAWSDVLRVPLAAYHTYLKATKTTGAILDAAIQLQEFSEISEIALDEFKPQLHDATAQDLGSAPVKTRVQLSQWFQNIFAPDWLARDSWDSRMAACRSSDRADDLNSNYSQEISVAIDQLSAAQDERQRRQAARRLGEIGTGNANAVAALINLLRTSQDDETLWTAVESLWQIDPGNPATGVSRVRLLDLGMQLARQSVALAVALIQKAERQVGIRLRVYPTANEAYLPTDLKLILLDEAEQTLWEVTARRADVYIQIKLNGQLGEQFSVRVALGDANITENFVI